MIELQRKLCSCLDPRLLANMASDFFLKKVSNQILLFFPSIARA